MNKWLRWFRRVVWPGIIMNLFFVLHLDRSRGGENRLSLRHLSVPGNSNAGHEYGTTLTDGEKWDLIEFLKTL
jgi:hypothetical protein